MEQGKAFGVIIDFTRIDTPWTRARTLIYEGKLYFMYFDTHMMKRPCVFALWLVKWLADFRQEQPIHYP